jgi:hypothetical protein
MRVRSEIRHTIRIGGHRLKRDRSITHLDTVCLGGSATVRALAYLYL